MHKWHSIKMFMVVVGEMSLWFISYRNYSSKVNVYASNWLCQTCHVWTEPLFAQPLICLVSIHAQACRRFIVWTWLHQWGSRSKKAWCTVTNNGRTKNSYVCNAQFREVYSLCIAYIYIIYIYIDVSYFCIYLYTHIIYTHRLFEEGSPWGSWTTLRN